MFRRTDKPVTAETILEAWCCSVPRSIRCYLCSSTAYTAETKLGQTEKGFLNCSSRWFPLQALQSFSGFLNKSELTDQAPQRHPWARRLESAQEAKPGRTLLLKEPGLRSHLSETPASSLENKNSLNPCPNQTLKSVLFCCWKVNLSTLK